MIMNEFFKWHCPNGNLHTFYSQSDMPIISDEHFWLINISQKFNQPTALVIRYEGDLEKDASRNSSSYRIANKNFLSCERLPKGITITKIFVQSLPTAFWRTTLLEKYLEKIQE